MSDEKIENEAANAANNEMSATPLGGVTPPQEEIQSAAAPAEGAEVQQPKPAGKKEKKEEAGHSVDYSNTFRELTEGDVVGGVVVHIDKEGVLVDVGTKSEGIIRPQELTRDTSLEPEQVVAVGDHIDVYVMESENQDGNLVLSKKRADFEKAWERVEQALNDGRTLTAMVSDRVKGGLVVDLGIRGFVPASHVGSGKVKNLEKYVGQSLPLRVIEVDRERRKVVLSHRKATEDEREKQRTETLATLAEGQIREGVIRRVTDYGAFIDLGGIDGLLHISEMSWTRIKHPTEVVKVGDKIQVMVLKLNLEQGKVSLGLRQILPDPWADVEHRYNVGDVITGAVSRLVPFGAFVQLEGGIEGIIPNSELAQRRVSKPEDVVQVGQSVEVKVIDLRPEERRITLSLRQLEQQKQRETVEREVRSYSFSQPEHKTTIADLVGDVMTKRTTKRSKAAERAEKEAEAAELAAAMEAGEEEIEPMFPTDETEAVEEAPKAEAAAVEEAPVVEEAAVEEAPVVEETAVEETAVEDTAVAEPAIEEPVVEEPAVEETPAEEPAVEAEAPAEEAPAAEAESAEEAPAAEAEAETEEKAE